MSKKRPCPFDGMYSPQMKQRLTNFQADDKYKQQVFDRTLTLLKNGSRRESLSVAINKENDDDASQSFTFGTMSSPSPQPTSNLRRWFPVLSLPGSPFNPPTNRSSNYGGSPACFVKCVRCNGSSRPLTPCSVCDCDLCPRCTSHCEQCTAPVCSLCSALSYKSRYDTLLCKQCAVKSPQAS